MTTPIPLFYSYAHEDEELRKDLAKQLKLLERTGMISGWNDRDIDAGHEWRTAIDENIKLAKIILLLISPDFINSDYCWKMELAHALERHNRGTAVVIPVFLRAVDLAEAPFANLLGLPTDAKPVTEWPNRDQAFLNVAIGIRRVAEKIRGEHADGMSDRERKTSAELAAVQRDAERIAQYRQLFDRSAFAIPCIFEETMVSLRKAIDQITEALGTGKVMSRDKEVYLVPRRAEFETSQFTLTLGQINKILLFTKRTLGELERHLSNPDGSRGNAKFDEMSFHHMEFLLLDLIGSGVSPSFVRAAFDYMDRVDAQRNAILLLLNGLFEEGSKLPTIPISSSLLAASDEMDRQGRTYDWENFYLRAHSTIRRFLDPQALGA
jgi:hypothetical protein